jgi:hypothetical protein
MFYNSGDTSIFFVLCPFVIRVHFSKRRSLTGARADGAEVGEKSPQTVDVPFEDALGELFER